MDIALFLARLILGLGLAAHGAQKLFGWYGGYGTKGTGQYMMTLGWSAGVSFAVLAGVGEFAGGWLTALGLGGPAGPALVIAVMVVAVATVHMGNGFFAAKNGSELPLMVIAGMLMLAFTGPGALSVDAQVGWLWLNVPDVAWRALGLGVALALIVVLLRRKPVPA